MEIRTKKRNINILFFFKCLPTCVTPLFDQLVINGQVDNAFSIFLAGDGSGNLTLGGIDPTIGPQSPFFSTPMMGINFYQVNLQSIKVGILYKIAIGFFFN